MNADDLYSRQRQYKVTFWPLRLQSDRSRLDSNAFLRRPLSGITHSRTNIQTGRPEPPRARGEPPIPAISEGLLCPIRRKELRSFVGLTPSPEAGIPFIGRSRQVSKHSA